MNQNQPDPQSRFLRQLDEYAAAQKRELELRTLEQYGGAQRHSATPPPNTPRLLARPSDGLLNGPSNGLLPKPTDLEQLLDAVRAARR